MHDACILFDFDGPLVDSETLFNQVFLGFSLQPE